MSTALVYRTSSPRAIDWFNGVEARERVIREKRDAYTAAITEQFGAVGKRYEHSTEELDNRPLMRDSRNRVTGVACKSGEKPPKGSGWRLDADSGFWKPDLRSKAGKERDTELEALHGVDSRSELHTIGAAGLAFVPGRMYQPGLRFRKETGDLYVSWGSKDCEDDMLAAGKAVDDVVWEAVPLSEWHSWMEELEIGADSE